MKYGIKYIQKNYISWLEQTARGYEGWCTSTSGYSFHSNKTEAHIYPDLNLAHKAMQKFAIDESYYYLVEEVPE